MAATVNIDVANQAFPPPPGTSQALPVASFTEVEGVPAIPPSFKLGTATPAAPDVNVSIENSVVPPVSDFIVTEGGTFQTNGTPSDIRTLTVFVTVVLDTGLPSERYQVFFSGTPNLQNLGLDLVGLNASFPNQAPGNAPEKVPTRAILTWSQDNIIVSKFDTNGNSMTAPVITNTVNIAVIRQGPSTIADFGRQISVDVSGTPVNAVTTPQSGTKFLGDFRASDGVVLPFIGNGQAGPPFTGTFEIENQTFGKGLPANVFPS